VSYPPDATVTSYETSHFVGSTLSCTAETPCFVIVGSAGSEQSSAGIWTPLTVTVAMFRNPPGPGVSPSSHTSVSPSHPAASIVACTVTV